MFGWFKKSRDDEPNPLEPDPLAVEAEIVAAKKPKKEQLPKWKWPAKVAEAPRAWTAESVAMYLREKGILLLGAKSAADVVRAIRNSTELTKRERNELAALPAVMLADALRHMEAVRASLYSTPAEEDEEPGVVPLMPPVTPAEAVTEKMEEMFERFQHEQAERDAAIRADIKTFVDQAAFAAGVAISTTMKR